MRLRPRPSDSEIVAVLEKACTQAKLRKDDLSYAVFKTLAADIRAAVPSAPSEARAALEKALDGYTGRPTEQLRIGQELIHRWAIVRRALAAQECPMEDVE